ncbi:NAD(P)/FAD-dependent oxidoreductase [Paenibacillus oenotherae]|uniref:NAD(P)/FAD-dependent oxidoreductase n=1 Tax=Paenibacillus oenotherae TaxID=1435645 RepID=A0ABS7DA71_9BACL|nr:NAD(P)/FAD-dependent oxidoreductase [Paenibacillus oenotherae]MBW7476838.1 NAD(P)/FAD-dependent oxidoreductase [Paenibacillus oenotherae]
MNFDVIVVGGGPSGLMASIAAASHGATTLLIDKGDKLGRKLGISGGGRCNVTNAKEIDELIRNIPGNGRFLHSSLANFSNRDIIAFFENLGIKLKEEDRGRMFPVSDKAKTVVEALVRKAKSSGVIIRINEPVAGLLIDEQRVQGIRLRSGERVQGSCVIVATGGKSVPHTGSTGDAYPWAEAAGHTVTELYPTEVPLLSREAFIQSKELQGLSLREVVVTVWNPKGKSVVQHDGDLLFTHFGLSGPTALKCSQFVVKIMKQFEVSLVKLTIDLYPGKTVEQLYKESLELSGREPKKAIKNILKGMLSERLIPIVLKKSGLNGDTTYDNIPKQPWLEMAALLKSFPINVSGTLSIEEAFVTGGGVNLKEIEPKTMHSKRTGGLFFCGEVLDIHGYTGGYNITAAFTTGYTAGKSAAEMRHLLND